MNEKNNHEHPILNVQNLRMYFPLTKGFFEKKYSDLKAVDNISFSVNKGNTFGLVGESGCGKTTVGKCILKINNLTGGEIYFEQRNISKLRKEELRKYRRDVQLIFQDPYGSLDPRQSVLSIVKEAIAAGGKEKDEKKIKNRAEELLTTVGLDLDMEDNYPHEMSGGQRQRLGIARALACSPKLIICDEPVSALDVSIQAQIINLFNNLQREFGLTYVFISHDLAVVRHIADMIAVMYLGKIVEVVDSDELYENSLHPYTRALISAVPITDYYVEQNRERIILPGEVPSPIDAPPGCPFHPRCSLATEKCKNIPPKLRCVKGNHKVSCHNV